MASRDLLPTHAVLGKWPPVVVGPGAGPRSGRVRTWQWRFCRVSAAVAGDGRLANVGRHQDGGRSARECGILFLKNKKEGEPEKEEKEWTVRSRSKGQWVCQTGRTFRK